MRLEKRLDKMAERIGVERIKLLFFIDEIQKELLELSPGKTRGPEGMQLAIAMTDLIDAARFMGAATEKIRFFVGFPIPVEYEAAIRGVVQRGNVRHPLRLPTGQKLLPQGAVDLPFPDLSPKPGLLRLSK